MVKVCTATFNTKISTFRPYSVLTCYKYVQLSQINSRYIPTHQSLIGLSNRSTVDTLRRTKWLFSHFVYNTRM